MSIPLYPRAARGITATMPASAVTDTQTGYAPEEASADTWGVSSPDTGSTAGADGTAEPGVAAGATAENRWYTFTAANAATVETQVANSVVGRMPAGSWEPGRDAQRNDASGQQRDR